MPASSPMLDDEAVHAIEAELARHIGPLSKFLVQKARPLAQSLEHGRRRGELDLGFQRRADGHGSPALSASL